MNRQPSAVVVACVVLWFPAASATHTPVSQTDVRQYEVCSQQAVSVNSCNTSDGDGKGEVAQFSFKYFLPHAFAVTAVGSNSTWRVLATYNVADADAVNAFINDFSFQYVQPTVTNTLCKWKIQTESGIVHREYASVHLLCANETWVKPDFAHQIKIAATTTNGDAVKSFTYSISLVNTERVVVPPPDWTAGNRHQVDGIADNVQALVNAAIGIASSLDGFFWLALVGASISLSLLARTRVAAFAGGVLAVFALFFGISRFASGITGELSVGVSLLALALSIMHMFPQRRPA